MEIGFFVEKKLLSSQNIGDFGNLAKSINFLFWKGKLFAGKYRLFFGGVGNGLQIAFEMVRVNDPLPNECYSINPLRSTHLQWRKSVEARSLIKVIALQCNFWKPFWFCVVVVFFRALADGCNRHLVCGFQHVSNHVWAWNGKFLTCVQC